MHMEIIYYNNIMIYSYLIQIRDFFVWFCDFEVHNQLWEEIGPI